MNEFDNENVGISRVPQDEQTPDVSGVDAQNDIDDNDTDDKGRTDADTKKQKDNKDDEKDVGKIKKKSDKNKEKSDNDTDEKKNKDKKEKSTKDEIKDTAKKAAVTHGVVKGTQHTITLTYLMEMLRLLMANIAQVAGSLFAMIGNAIVAGFHTAVSAITSFFATATSSVAGTIITGVSVICVGTLAFGVISSSIQSSQIAKLDEKPKSDCSTEFKYAMGGVNATALVGQRLENAKLICATMRQYGLADYNIAGMLANMDAESGIDPTAVETIYSESFIWGPRKQHAESVGFDMRRISSSYSSDHSKISLCGIGLGQWTNSRNTLLRNYAASMTSSDLTDIGADDTANAMPAWCDLGVQLSFMIAPTSQGGDSRSSWLASWAPESDAETAASNYCLYWEGNKSEMNNPARIKKGPYYATEMALWDLSDESYSNFASSIITKAGEVSANGTDEAINKAKLECEQGSISTANNSSIAAAAVSIAYGTIDEGRGNNGTSIYQKVHDAVIGSSAPYMDCGACVSTAVRWSGADDNFPALGTGNMLAYMVTSPKWSEVSFNGDISVLAPGDVLVIHSGGKHHILIFTGHDLIAAKYPEAPENYAFVSASQDERSPGCGAGYRSWPSGYRVFRNIQKEGNSKYTNAGLTESDATGD